VPATESQASHWPPHAWSQQTPSTQNPLEHASAERHAPPFEAFGVQVPAAHHAEPTHCELVAHDVAQPPFAQRKGAHSMPVALAMQVPEPSQI
jgi:hypothetical protein